MSNHVCLGPKKADRIEVYTDLFVTYVVNMPIDLDDSDVCYNVQFVTDTPAH